MGQPGELPRGVVTFLLTDIEASTPLWERHGAAMGVALAGHQGLARAVGRARGAGHQAAGRGRLDAVGVHPGQRRRGRGPDLQRALGRARRPGEIALPTRVALHTGEAELRDGDYFGPALNRAARLRR
jgi:class 3 adenylate cyclase